jgi:hypothetical protein
MTVQHSSPSNGHFGELPEKKRPSPEKKKGRRLKKMSATAFLLEK